MVNVGGFFGCDTRVPFIDSPFIDVHNYAGFFADCEKSVKNGANGKMIKKKVIKRIIKKSSEKGEDSRASSVKSNMSDYTKKVLIKETKDINSPNFYYELIFSQNKYIFDINHLLKLILYQY